MPAVIIAGGNEGLCAESLPFHVGRRLSGFCSGEGREWEAELLLLLEMSRGTGTLVAGN